MFGTLKVVYDAASEDGLSGLLNKVAVGWATCVDLSIKFVHPTKSRGM